MTSIEESIQEIEYDVGLPNGMRYDKIRVQSTPTNRMESLVVKLEMLLDERDRIRLQIDSKYDFIEEIQQREHIYSPDEWKVVKHRFLKGETYAQVEKETNFSFRKVRRLVGRIKSKNICLERGIY